MMDKNSRENCNGNSCSKANPFFWPWLDNMYPSTFNRYFPELLPEMQESQGKNRYFNNDKVFILPDGTFSINLSV